jgi:hypothetical protein
LASLYLHSARPNDDTDHPEDTADSGALSGADCPGDQRPTPVRTGRRTGVHRLSRSAPPRHMAYAVALATVSLLAVGNSVAGGPIAAATASPELTESAAVADALGIDGSGTVASPMEERELLGQLAASRAQRDADQAAAVASQVQAEQAATAAKAEAEARAAAEAAAAVEAASAAPAPAASTAATAVARISNSSGAVRPQAQAAADSVVSNVPGADGITIGGTRPTAADPGGHPSGLALDYMCSPALGDAIAEYHIAHWDELGVEYIIWQQRMLSSPGGAWKAMASRGSATANHMDHVHVNYRG